MIGMVFIEQFSAQCRIGCTGKERQAEQPVLIDVHCLVDFGPALASDSRKDCVDYCTLREIAEQCVKSDKVYRLLESLAQEIAKQTLRLPHVQRVTVAIRKPHKISSVKNVGISLELSREEV